jgi:hypothetical protein
VLRPVNYNGAISASTVRMVVEFPSGARVPVEGSEVARGTLRPFQIIDVRRGDDGQVNIYAREVTVPVNQTSPSSSNRYRLVQGSRLNCIPASFPAAHAIPGAARHLTCAQCDVPVIQPQHSKQHAQFFSTAVTI